MKTIITKMHMPELVVSCGCCDQSCKRCLSWWDAEFGCLSTTVVLSGPGAAGIGLKREGLEELEDRSGGSAAEMSGEEASETDKALHSVSLSEILLLISKLLLTFSCTHFQDYDGRGSAVHVGVCLYSSCCGAVVFLSHPGFPVDVKPHCMLFIVSESGLGSGAIHMCSTK